jgi:hypothetical protein
VLSLPADWQLADPPGPAVPLVAAEPEVALGEFRANVVVTVDAAAMGFKDWQLGNDQLLPGALREYQLLDLESLTVSGHEGVRRLATHTVQDRSVTMEQWAGLVGQQGWTVTFTVPTMRYAAMAPGLRVLAQTFSVTAPERTA